MLEIWKIITGIMSMISKEILDAMFGHFAALTYLGGVVSTQYGHGQSEKKWENHANDHNSIKGSTRDAHFSQE